MQTGNHGNLPGPGPGRPKGVPNKVNRDLKEAYLMAANLAGGKEGLVGYLKKQAELENPSAFMTGLSKLLPRCWREIRTRRSSSSAFTTLGTRTEAHVPRRSSIRHVVQACANPAFIETWRLCRADRRAWMAARRARASTKSGEAAARKKNRRGPRQVLSRGPA